MNEIMSYLEQLLSASPMVLALLVGLAAIGLATFAIYIVYQVTKRREAGDGD